MKIEKISKMIAWRTIEITIEQNYFGMGKWDCYFGNAKMAEAVILPVKFGTNLATELLSNG